MPDSKSHTMAWSSNSNASALLCTGTALLRPKSARSIAKPGSGSLMSPATTNQSPLSESAFIAGFHAIGEERYHHKHPFHLLMHEGKLTRGQLQAWALNRYYYQSRIPIKDAAILARTEDPGFRLAWRKRILDHDGDGTKPGGIEKWLHLVEVHRPLARASHPRRRHPPRHALRRTGLRRLRLHEIAHRSRRFIPLPKCFRRN